MKAMAVGMAALLLAVSGCEKKVEPVVVGEMNEYRDPAFGFHMKYPKEWKQLGQAGKALFVRSQEVANKFMDPRGGEEGGQVMVQVIRYEGKTADAIVQESRDELGQIPAQVSPSEQITVGGKASVKVPYSIKVTSKTSITGFEVFVPGDTAVYKLDFAGYGMQFDAHGALFAAMLASFEPPIVVAKKSDVWQASPNLTPYPTSVFTMQVPENLNTVPQQKGDKELVMEMRADRLDCSIHIDVFGAKGLPVEKVWEQNKKRYRAKATGETTIDGNKAFWVDYSAAPNIGSRATFVVKNDRVVRVTMNWYAPQKDVYFPAFEKCVQSIQLK